MKRNLIIVLLIGMMMMLTACGSDRNVNSTVSDVEEAVTTEGEEGYVIGVAMNAADEMRVQWLNYLQEKAEKEGYTIISTNANGDLNQQISDIDSLILRKPDVIIVTPTNSDSAAPGIEAIAEAGIPSIVIDFSAGTDKYTVWFGGQQVTSGTVAGNYMQSLLDSNPDLKLNCGIIVGSFSMQTTQPRIDLITEACPELNVIATAEAGFAADTAMGVCEDWLQAYPDMNCIYAFNDDMAIGVIQALKAADVNMDEFYVIGTDGTEAGKEYLKTGEMDATAYRNMDTETTAVMEIVGKILDGQDVDQNIAPPSLELLLPEDVQ